MRFKKLVVCVMAVLLMTGTVCGSTTLSMAAETGENIFR